MPNVTGVYVCGSREGACMHACIFVCLHVHAHMHALMMRMRMDAYDFLYTYACMKITVSAIYGDMQMTCQ